MWAPSDFECLTYLEFAFNNLPSSWDGNRFQFLGVLIDVEELDKKKDITRKELLKLSKRHADLDLPIARYNFEWLRGIARRSKTSQLMCAFETAFK
jgi:hypothetical protein